MVKKIPTVLLLVATIISASLMVKVDSLQVYAKEDKNVFLQEVRKPDGSGYIFEGEDGINISVETFEN